MKRSTLLMHRKDNNPRPPSAIEEPAEALGGSVRPESPSLAARPRLASDMDPPPEEETKLAPSPADSGREVTPVIHSSEIEEVILQSAEVPAGPPPVQLDPRIGETLVGRYRLDKLIGKGGMGRVYRATQFPLNRPVAVKILNPEFQKKDPQFVRRFFLEAASAARLTHPNTITVFDYGEAESGELFIAMEYLKGRPLSRIIAQEAPFAPERTLHVAMQICRALREAHTKGIIHRDLKPGNILLLEEGDDADFVKVLDFGLVKLFNPPDLGAKQSEDMLTPEPAEGELTKAGMFLGSPKYMSPEQIQGMPLDPRTDIYSLGVLMFQMVTGKPPFTGTSSVEVIYKHVNAQVPTFADMGVDVPFELEDIIINMLAKRREDRFESMSALLVRLKDIRRLLTGISAGSETGIDIDVSDLAQLNRPTVHPRPLPPHVSQSGQHVRPQTRPPTGTISAINPTPAMRESPFAESNIDDSSANELLGRRGPTSKLARMAPVAAATALVVVLGALAYVFSSSLGQKTVTAPPVIAESPEQAAAASGPVVRFVSSPPGAEIFEHGVSIGNTPLSRTYPAESVGEPLEFLFKMDGFRDELHNAVLPGKGLEISVRLVRRGEAAPPPPATGRGKNNGTTEEYKENPY